MNALQFLEDTLRAQGWGAVPKKVERFCEQFGRALGADFDWRIARIAFAIGHPDAREDIDAEEVRMRVEEVYALQRAKSQRYYRIGDTSWTLYVFVAVWPEAEDRAFLLPAPPPGQSYRLDPTGPTIYLGDAPVPWPPFEPPLVSQLGTTDKAQQNASGFVPEDSAVRGNGRLPAPLHPRLST